MVSSLGSGKCFSVIFYIPLILGTDAVCLVGTSQWTLAGQHCQPLVPTSTGSSRSDRPTTQNRLYAGFGTKSRLTVHISPARPPQGRRALTGIHSQKGEHVAVCMHPLQKSRLAPAVPPSAVLYLGHFAPGLAALRIPGSRSSPLGRGTLGMTQAAHGSEQLRKTRSDSHHFVPYHASVYYEHAGDISVSVRMY